MAPPPAPAATNPYREGSLIFALTTPPERTNKLAPRWKGPFVVKRVPNPYQVVYEDGSAWRTIHINHAKPAKLPATGFPAPIPAPEPPRPALGYLPRSLQRPLPRQPSPPPQPAAPAEGSPSPPASSPAVTPPASRRLTRAAAAANRNSASRSAQPPPTAPARANENTRAGHQLRRSARLTPRACAIKSAPPPPTPQSLSKTMARTYPLSLAFNQCLGSKKTPTPSPVYIWRIYTMARPSTLSRYSNSLTPSRRRWILPLASPCEARSHPLDISVCATP